MPKVFVLVGLPGTGKTTWRETFANIESEVHTGFVVCSQDDLVEDFAEHQGLTYTDAFRKADLKTFEKQVKQTFADALAADRNIILDRTNVSKKSRAIFLKMIPAHYEVEAVIFHCDPVLLDHRLARRAKRTGKFIPGFVIRDMNRNFQQPTYDEGFSAIWHVYAEEPVYLPLLRLAAWIKRVFWK